MLVKDSGIKEKSKRVCKYFLSGSCAYGEFCRFLHVVPVSQVETPKTNVTSADVQSGEIIASEKALEDHTVGESCGDGQTKAQTSSFQPRFQKAVCRYYVRGYCGRGKKCPFLHERRIFHKPKKENGISVDNENSTNLTETSQQDLKSLEDSTAEKRPVNTAARNEGVKNFSNDRKSYMRRFFVPKALRESQQRFYPKPNLEKTPEELRRTELEMLEKKFPGVKRTDGECGVTFLFNFKPTDPDWPFDVKEFEMVAEFPTKYPLEAMKISLGNNEQIPDTVKSQLEKDLMDHVLLMHDSSNRIDLAFRPFLRWFDRSIEQLLTSALKQYKRELILAASGIQIISANQLREKYKGAVPTEEPSNEKASEKPTVLLKKADCDDVKPDIKESQSNDGKILKSGEEHDDDDNDDDECEDEEDEDEPPANTEQPKAAIEPIRKGTDVRLNSLEISGIATLVCTKFKAIMACGRCSNKVDVGVSIPSQSNSSAFSIGCPYCSSKGSAMFHRCIVHGRQNSMGFFNLDGCQVVDVLLDGCEFLLSCFNCMKNSTVKTLFPGQQSDTWCMECHQKMTIKVNNVKVIRLDSSAPLIGGDKTSAEVGADRKPKKVKDPLIQDGKPLPMFGSCKHFKKSFRWFRFPCCGKAYPCDHCHDENESHEMKLASRVICGFCAMEQAYSPSNPCVRCNGQMSNKFTSHWEGGKGCRDKIKMSRLDSKKYANCSKTIATNSQKPQVTKTIKLRHI